MADHSPPNHPFKPQALYLWFTLIGLGFAARVVLWWVSFGTNDAKTWEDFGRQVSDRGLVWTVENHPVFNHPPIPAYWAMTARALSEFAHTHGATGALGRFPTWFKAPMILADAGTCLLIWAILRNRAGTNMAAAVVASFACNPVSVLITSHHCNTDPLYVMLSLLAVWLLADCNRFFLAGLALGAAINIKLVPILLLAPLLCSTRTWKSAGDFFAGLAVMAVPSFLVLLATPRAFLSKIVFYKAQPEHWGIGHWLLEYYERSHQSEPAGNLVMLWNDYGAYLLLASIAVLSVVQLARRLWDVYGIAALTMTLFLVLAPGFGVQYLLAPTALLLICWPAGGLLYSAVGGMFLLVSYLIRWDGTFPIFTWFEPQFDYLPGRTFGQLAWGVLVIAAGHFLTHRRLAPNLSGGSDAG